MRKVQVVLQDDIDGSEPAQTVHFALDGTDYEIDLSDEHAAELRDCLAPWIAAGRRADHARIPEPRSKSRAPSGAPPTSGAGPRGTASRSPPAGASAGRSARPVRGRPLTRPPSALWPGALSGRRPTDTRAVRSLQRSHPDPRCQFHGIGRARPRSAGNTTDASNTRGSSMVLTAALHRSARWRVLLAAVLGVCLILVAPPAAQR